MFTFHCSGGVFFRTDSHRQGNSTNRMGTLHLMALADRHVSVSPPRSPFRNFDSPRIIYRVCRVQVGDVGWGKALNFCFFFGLSLSHTLFKKKQKEPKKNKQKTMQGSYGCVRRIGTNRHVCELFFFFLVLPRRGMGSYGFGVVDGW